MLTYAVVAFAAYVAGCYSHKWAAKAFYDGTGLDAQKVADQTKNKLSDIGKARKDSSY